MANQFIRPDGDITTNWDTTTGTAHWDQIDEDPDTPTDTEYIETSTISDVDEITFGATVANTDSVSQVLIRIRCAITDSTDTRIIRLQLFKGAVEIGSAKDIDTTQLAFNDGTLVTTTETWSGAGFPITKTEADDLRLRMTFQ